MKDINLKDIDLSELLGSLSELQNFANKQKASLTSSEFSQVDSIVKSVDLTDVVAITAKIEELKILAKEEDEKIQKNKDNK